MINFFSNIVRACSLFFHSLASGVITQYIKFKLIKKKSTSFEKINKSELLLGVKLRKFLERSGPSFIKLGQILSTRHDVVGEIIANELSKLQDDVPSFPFNIVKNTIESQLNLKLEQVFSHIEETPVAAASIAQVHKAYLLNDDEVAVKVLRPNIAKKFYKDIELFSLLTKVINFFMKDSKRLRLKEVVDTLQDVVARELDLRHEAACADKIRENSKRDAGIVIPEVYWDFTSKKIMVTQWVKGTSINQREKLIEEGHDLKEIAKKLAINFFNQVYRDGFFHADMHPGNLFVDSNGDIIMLDFGITGVLRRDDRIFIAKVIYAFINKDYDEVSKLHFDAGIVPDSKMQEYFALACRSIGEPIVGRPVNEISIGRLLKQLIEISKRFEMVTQPQFILLQKTIMTIEGVGMYIYPGVNMWQLAEPWIKEWATDNFGIKSNVKKGLAELVELAKNFPHLISIVNKIIEEQERKKAA